MDYEKLNLQNDTVLNEEHLAHFEQGIFNAYELPEVTEEDNKKVLGVVNGNWGVMTVESFPKSEDFDQTLMMGPKTILYASGMFSRHASAGFMCISSPRDPIDLCDLVVGDTYDVQIAGITYSELVLTKENGAYCLSASAGDSRNMRLYMYSGSGADSRYASIASISVNSGYFTTSSSTASSGYSAVRILHHSTPVAFKDSIDGKTYHLKRNSATGAVAAFEASIAE